MLDGIQQSHHDGIVSEEELIAWTARDPVSAGIGLTDVRLEQ
jgi:hypothetical protein